MENDIPKIDLPDNWVIGKLTQNDISLLSLYANYPCRLKAGIFAFCRKGDIEASLNLTRYRVKANTLITIQPGTILQIHKVEGDVEIYFMGFSSDFINRTDTRKPAIDIHYAVNKNTQEGDSSEGEKLGDPPSENPSCGGKVFHAHIA